MAEVARGSVVVPVDETPGSVVCLRSLGRAGVKTIAAAEDETVPALRSRYADESISVPSPDADLPGYSNALLSLAERPDIEAILPIREQDAYVLSRRGEAFAEHVTPLWPTVEGLRTAHDRLRLTETAKAADVPVPETALLGEVDDWDRNRVVKSRYALLTADVVDGLTPPESATPDLTAFPETSVEPDVEAMRAEVGHDPIVQAYVPGAEYSFRALYDRGEPVVTTQLKQHRGTQSFGGSSVYRETIKNDRLDRLGRALLDHLDWHGVAEVEFRRHRETGEFRLMEMNPRIWASVACDIHSGADYPRYFWNMAVGDRASVRPEYEAGVGSHLLRGELVHIYNVIRADPIHESLPPHARTAREIVTSLYEQPSFDLLSLDDPGPFLVDIRNLVRDLQQPN